MASEKEDVPLTSAPAPRVQYFDVSDAESTDSEPGVARSGQPYDSEEEELEVFQDGQAIPMSRAPTSSARTDSPPQEVRPPPHETDPFGTGQAAKQTGSQPPLPPPTGRAVPSLFDGTGIEGTSAKVTDLLEDSDEFDYAFEGKAREGETHKRVFNAESIPVPIGLLADKASKQLHSLCEDEEEEEEGEEEGQFEEVETQQPAMTQDVAPLSSEPDEWEAASASVAALLQSDGQNKSTMQAFEIDQQRRASESSDNEELWDRHAAMIGGANASTTATGATFYPDSHDSDIQAVDTAASAPVELTAVAGGGAAFAASPYLSEFSAAEEVVEAGGDPAQSMFLDPSDIDLFGSDEAAESPAVSPSLEAQASLLARSSPSSSTPVQPQGASALTSPAKPKKSKDEKRMKKGKKGPSIVSSQKVRAYLASIDISPYLNEIVETEADRDVGCFARLLAKLTGPPKLATAELREERTRIFCCAKIKFDEGDAMHFKILSAVYQRFTSLPKPQRFGTHWMDVGFQGSDPATDLRSCGMLGLMQLLYLWDHHPGNAGVIYDTSRHAVHEFPLAVVGMNITKWCLQNLRSGRLTSMANKAGSVIWTVMEFYVGIWYYFYQTWCQHGATMAESGYILKEVEQYCKENTSKLLSLANRVNLETERPQARVDSSSH